MQYMNIIKKSVLIKSKNKKGDHIDPLFVIIICDVVVQLLK